MKKKLKNMILFLFLLLFLSGCGGDRYQEGYNSGYKEGYTVGFNDGKREGYLEGTSVFIKDTMTPSLGFVIVLLTSIFTFSLTYYLLKPLSKRFIEKFSNNAEMKRQEVILNKELKRKLFSCEDESRANALNLASFLYESSIKAINKANTEKEFEHLKDYVEKKIFEVQTNELNKIIISYEKTISNVKNSSNLSTKEKIKLYQEIKKSIVS
ncbi:MAG: hypothetical protein AABZ74_08950 [Cyanobacteriota bacterium]